MAFEPVDTDAAVIGRDDVDYGGLGGLSFEGDDLELPSAESDYLDDSPGARHTDFTGSGQTVDGVKFDFGGLFKGVTDGVSATAKAVAEVAKAKAAADSAKDRDGAVIGRDDKPEERTPATPKQPEPKEPKQPSKDSSTGGVAVLAIGALLGAGAALYAITRRTKRRAGGF